MACGCDNGNCQIKYKVVVPMPVTRSAIGNAMSEADRVRRDAIRKALNQK